MGAKQFRLIHQTLMKQHYMVIGIYSGRRKELAPKYFPINDDLKNLLREMGYEQKINAEEYIIYPNRNVTEKNVNGQIE